MCVTCPGCLMDLIHRSGGGELVVDNVALCDMGGRGGWKIHFVFVFFCFRIPAVNYSRDLSVDLTVFSRVFKSFARLLIQF